MSLQGYDTHLPMLSYCVAHSTGPVIECGTGGGSTPFLHAMCKGRKLISGEYDPAWLEKFREFGSQPDMPGDPHELHHVIDWIEWGQEIRSRVGPVGTILVDQSPGETRTPFVKALKGWAKFWILHDSERDHNSGANYKYEDVIDLFKYVSEYRFLRPYTLVLSDHERVPVDQVESKRTPPPDCPCIECRRMCRV